MPDARLELLLSDGGRCLNDAYEVEGAPFYLIERDGGYELWHHDSSLFGAGPTLLAAELQVLACAQELAPMYVDAPLHRMTLGALALRDLIIRCLGYRGLPEPVDA